MKNSCYFLLILFLFSGTGFRQKTGNLPVKLTKLTPEIWVHTSAKMLNGQPFPSNGLVANTSAGLVLIDTGWGEEPTIALLDQLKKRFHKPVIACIVTHAHDDRLGGISILKQNNIPVYSTRLTAEIAGKTGFPKPQFLLPDDTVLTFGQTQLRTFYPGPGHAPDNITVWFPAEKVLFGGCFVKSTETQSLGNIADANLTEWPNALQKVMAEFPDPKFVIPGHQGWGNGNALQHTLNLLTRTPETQEKNAR